MLLIKNFFATRLYEGYRKKILAGANDQTVLKARVAVDYSANNFNYQFYKISAYCRSIHSLLVCKADNDQNIWVDIERLSELLGIAATR